MKNLFLILTSFFFLLSHSSPSLALDDSILQPGSSGHCKDFVIEFVDRDKGEVPGRSVTAVFNCHGGNYSIPGMTSIHFIETNPEDGTTCHFERTCGNIRKWKGYFATSAYYSDPMGLAEIFRFIHSGGLLDSHLEYGFFARFFLSWNHFQHYCKKPGEKICLGGKRP